MTRKELVIREMAVTNAYIKGHKDIAIDYVMELRERNLSKKLYRFRPPKMYEIDALKNKQIYLCRPSVYEDAEDCKIEYNFPDLFEYFMSEVKPEKYRNLLGFLMDKTKVDELTNAMNENPKFIKINENIKNQCLVACITQTYNDYMWEHYAQHHEGVCFEYEMDQVILAIKNDLRFFPIRYVDWRNDIEDIRFDLSDYADINKSFHRSRMKYSISCLTKNKVPYSNEYEWRLLYEYMELKDGKTGHLFNFILPSKIYLGKNIVNNTAFEKEIIDFANSAEIPIEKIK